MAISPEELKSCFIYQVGALAGFLKAHGMPLNHIKPHGAVYGQCARSALLASAAVSVAKVFSTPDNPSVKFVGLAGTEHEIAAKKEGVPFIPEWFADLEYSPEGKLLITQ
ncbi:LamB/YcsF family-domain-containing protein [Cyathus striatus]|nr:LamB/YcsF family-domain-containing protein [Cyathus striatus]